MASPGSARTETWSLESGQLLNYLSDSDEVILQRVDIL